MPASDTVRSLQGSVEDAAVDRLIGARVGNYVIDRPLARGGMGAVFVAKHPTLGREVAVKFLSREYERDPVLLDRFLQEARITARLRHPNIVDIYDFGELDGSLYYIMELLVGRDLAVTMREAVRFDYELTVDYLEQICAALEAAHAVGIVHRDLKPANVFVLSTEPPLIKLMDFGVAKVKNRTLAGNTLDGQILGTPTHMSPEQALGELDRVTPQSDLYSLGVIAYEMLTGSPVFSHESDVMLMAMHIRDPITPIRERNSEVPPRVAELVEWCLEKDSSKRPKSARALAARLVAARQIARSQAKGGATKRRVRVEGETAYYTEHYESKRHELALVEQTGTRAREPAGQPSPVVFPATISRTSTGRNSRAVRLDLPVSDDLGARGELEAPSADETTAATELPVVLEPELNAPSLLSTDDEGAESVVLSQADRDVLGKLLRRMQRKGDFPAFVRNVGEISVKADADREYSAGQLGESILKDYALTAKLLRSVNTMFSGRFGHKIFSVQHAVVILGFDRVRSLALGISVLKSGAVKREKAAKAGPKDHERLITDAAIGALVSGEIARKLALVAQLEDPELAMMCAMFRNLGYQLVLQYLPDLYEEIIALMESEKVSLQSASQRVLGTSFRKLGVGVAERWSLPSVMIDALACSPPVGADLRREEDRLAALAQLANDLTETVARADSPERAKEHVLKLAKRHERWLPLDKDALETLFTEVRESFDVRYAALFGPEKSQSRFLQKAPSKARGEVGESVLGASGVDREAAAGDARSVRRARAERGAPATETTPTAQLAALEQRLAEEVNRGLPAEDSINSALSELMGLFGVARLILLVANGERTLLARFAVGTDAEAMLRELSFPLQAGDVFATALNSGKEAKIDDAYASEAMKRVPQRYYEVLGSTAFAVYPCVAKGEPVVLLLADAEAASRLPAGALVNASRAVRKALAQLARAVN